MIKIMETSSRQNQDEIIESMLNFPDEPGSKRVRTKFDNIIVLLLDACSFTGLARYYPKLYNFLEATRRGEVLGYSGFRYFPGLSGVNSPPNKLRMFGNETDVKYIHKNHANKSHIWINEYARMHGYFVAHGGVEAKYQLGDAASWYTDAVDWTFNQSLYSNFSAACGIPPDHRDECKYMKMFGANTSLSEPGIKFDGGTGCNNYCYFGTSRHSLLLNTMTRLIQRKQVSFE